MTNIINVDLKAEDFKHCAYYEAGNDVGVAMRDKSVILLPVNLNEIELCVGNESLLLKREVLAEFLNVAKVFFDAKDKWMPDLEMLSLNYK